MKVSLHTESWAARTPFRITGNTFLSFDPVLVEIADGEHIGRGEAHGVYYLGETSETMSAQIENVIGAVETGAGRKELLRLLPAGGARCALDCALWDLEAKRAGKRAWTLAGVAPAPVETVFTIGADAPEAMARAAACATDFRRLKLKLTGDRPADCARAVRAARPDARLMVDANQGFTLDLLRAALPAFEEARVELIEQPLPRGGDAALEGFPSPIPLCADESCLTLDELDQAAPRYQMINIKLDKTGGLTHALQLAAAARARGLGLMVGCMGGSSLAMAPAFVLAQSCDWVDLDGPLLAKYDRPPGIVYEGGRITEVPAACWG